MRRYQRQLNIIERRRRLKSALQLGGILIAVIGFVLLPVFQPHPEKATAFTVIRNLGPFTTWGLTLLIGGVLVIALSFLIRGDADE